MVSSRYYLLPSTVQLSSLRSAWLLPNLGLQIKPSATVCQCVVCDQKFWFAIVMQLCAHQLTDRDWFSRSRVRKFESRSGVQIWGSDTLNRLCETPLRIWFSDLIRLLLKVACLQVAGRFAWFPMVIWIATSGDSPMENLQWRLSIFMMRLPDF